MHCCILDMEPLHNPAVGLSILKRAPHSLRNHALWPSKGKNTILVFSLLLNSFKCGPCLPAVDQICGGRTRRHSESTEFCSFSLSSRKLFRLTTLARSTDSLNIIKKWKVPERSQHSHKAEEPVLQIHTLRSVVQSGSFGWKNILCRWFSASLPSSCSPRSLRCDLCFSAVLMNTWQNWLALQSEPKD